MQERTERGKNRKHTPQFKHPDVISKLTVDIWLENLISQIYNKESLKPTTHIAYFKGVQFGGHC